jgi:hypothetical protein
VAKAYVRGSQQALRTQAALESLLGSQVMKVRVICVCVLDCADVCRFRCRCALEQLGSKCSILICR